MTIDFRHRTVRAVLLVLVAAFFVACQQTPETVGMDGATAPPAAMTSADLNPDASPSNALPDATPDRRSTHAPTGSVTWQESQPPPAPPAAHGATARPRTARAGEAPNGGQFPDRPRTASRHEMPRPAPPATAETALDPTPRNLITLLEEVGLSDGFNGKGWHRSGHDGRWNAVLLKNYGRNEVSCLLESGDAGTVQRIELEAEFYRPGVYEQPMMLQFTKALAAVYPEAPRPLLEAIASKQTWYDEDCYLTRDDYRSGGFGLRLRINR